MNVAAGFSQLVTSRTFEAAIAATPGPGVSCRVVDKLLVCLMMPVCSQFRRRSPPIGSILLASESRWMQLRAIGSLLGHDEEDVKQDRPRRFDQSMLNFLFYSDCTALQFVKLHHEGRTNYHFRLLAIPPCHGRAAQVPVGYR